ncbi:hypothetical protein ACTWQJ_47410, partial [Streptomyces sp. KR55]
IPLAVLLGGAGFLTNPAVNSRVFGVLGEARTLGGAVNIAAFNLGIAVAPWVGGLLIDAGSDWRSRRGSVRPSRWRRSGAPCWTDS